MLEISLPVSRTLKMNSVAYDFIYAKNNQPTIIEITFAYGFKGASKAPGYWDDNLIWHEGILENFQFWMIEKIIEKVRNKI